MAVEKVSIEINPSLHNIIVIALYPDRQFCMFSVR